MAVVLYYDHYHHMAHPERIDFSSKLQESTSSNYTIHIWPASGVIFVRDLVTLYCYLEVGYVFKRPLVSEIHCTINFDVCHVWTKSS